MTIMFLQLSALCLCLILGVFTRGVTSFATTTTTTTSRRGQPLMMTASFDLDELEKIPELIIFDLDNTLWTPELYQLRKLQRANQVPVAGKDVKLMSGTERILEDYLPALQAKGVQFGVASRTKSVEWAHALLGQFGLTQSFHFIEIFPGNKKKHFSNIAQASGIKFDQMLFFDDARDGKFGNCEPVSELGVLSVHCPNGLDEEDVFTTALSKFSEWDQQASTIVEWDGSVTKGEDLLDDRQVQVGTVKMIHEEKRYGFIQYRHGTRSRELFFHFRHLIDMYVEQGDSVSFIRTRDPKNGKFMASEVSVVENVNKTQVECQCFTMNQPFAALLANGYKDLETRNGTMFTVHPPGTKLLLHVGRRTYPDEGKHMEVMRSGGDLNDDEIERLKSLPAGFGKGSVVAIMEIGETYATSIAERSAPDFQRRMAAFGNDAGRYVTEIRRIEYLKTPIKMPGQPGIFTIRIDPSMIPEGWEVAPMASPYSSSSNNNNKNKRDSSSGNGAYATISG